MRKLDTVLPGKQVVYVTSGNEGLLEQIRRYTTSRKIVLEHGAAMIFVLFMQPGAQVVQLLPPQIKTAQAKLIQKIVRVVNGTLHDVFVNESVLEKMAKIKQILTRG
jgi:capsular polysaccharide biosynthesis protein